MVIYFQVIQKSAQMYCFFFTHKISKNYFFNPLKKKSFFTSAGIRLKAKNNLSKEVLKTLLRTSPTSAEKLPDFSAEVGQLHT